MNLKLNRILFLIIPFLILAGCGVKSDPLPPELYPTPQITDISHKLEGEKVILSWKEPDKKLFRETSFDSYNVYKASYLKKDFCEKCPVNFYKVAETTNNYYLDTIDPEKYYFYQITVVAENGVESNRSETVKVGF